MEGEKKTINSPLWLECAGPLVTLPTIGSQVVYFPQGHSEQVAASTQKDADIQIPGYPNLPSQLICQLHNITLHADQETDEVYAQMTLQPINGQQEKDPFLAPDLGIQAKQPNISFCKTLTASDTSTHGGFSIPRRAAEKVFPPLDYTKQPPAQELVARDLHNNEWHFRHIYRGQPRRHLLTTGWSVFVSAKRLQAGDTVLFLRDESGQLLLGIRRANRQQINMPSSLLSKDSMLIGVLAAAAHAAATNSRFTIYYNPRASPSEFVIPLSKYNTAVYHKQVSVGMRFRMELETEDSSTRRYMGTITGIGDLDPIRWPNSSWRSLKVGWDESTAGQRQRRVSLWEIEPLAPYFSCHPSLLLRSKRPRCLGDEDDFVSSIPRSPIWGDGKIDVRSLNYPGLVVDQWMRMQQRPDALSLNQSEQYRAMAAAALQEFRNTESLKQSLPQQSPTGLQLQQMQYRTQVPQQSMCSMQQQETQLQQQQDQTQSVHQQQPPLPAPQPQQHQQFQQQQQQQFQQQHQFQHHQQSLSLPSIQPGVLQPSLMPSAFRASSPFSESDLSFSPVPSSLPSQGIIPRSSLGSMLNDNITQPQGGMRAPIQQQTTLLPGTGQDAQSSGSWVASLKETNQPDCHVFGPRDLESPVNSAVSFSVPRGETTLPSLRLQSSTFDFRDVPQDESFQSDLRSHFIFGVNIDNPLPLNNTRSFSKDLQSQYPMVAGNPIPGPNIQVSSAGIDVPENLDDNGFLQQSSNWPHVQPPIRTFTKVYKMGSVGRSIDLTRLQNYEELRSELARMFNLEGQLADPQRSGWQLVFVDNEEDVLLVGDDPWEEFVSCVRSIRILAPSEVLQINQEGIEYLNSVPSQRQTSSSSEDCVIQQDSRNQSHHAP